MKPNNFILKGSTGRKTTLDNAYRKLIIDVLNDLNEEREGRWETYNRVMEELLETGYQDHFEEVRYRLTDNENPNEVMIDILGKQEHINNYLLMILKKRIEDYYDEDFFKRFYE